MQKNVEQPLSISPLHPDYEYVHYIQTLIGLLTNPQAHFHAKQAMDKVNELPEVEKIIEKQEREKMIADLKEAQEKILSRKMDGLEAYTEFMSTLKTDKKSAKKLTKKLEQRAFENKFDDFVAETTKIDTEGEEGWPSPTK